MAQITMQSAEMRRSFKDVLAAIGRGDEIVVIHYGRPAARITAPVIDRDLTVAMGALDILACCRATLEQARRVEEMPPARSARGSRGRTRVEQAAADLRAWAEMTPWLDLADALGEDGVGDLPEALDPEQAGYVLEVAARHLAAAAERLGGSGYPDGVAGIAGQAGDERFVAMLTGQH